MITDTASAAPTNRRDLGSTIVVAAARHPVRWFLAERGLLAAAVGMLPVGLSFSLLDIYARASALGIVLALQGVGLVVSLIVLGGVGDLIAPRRLLVLADALYAASAAALALLAQTHSHALVAYGAASIVTGASAGLVNSALQALLAAVVSPQDRQRVNGLRSLLRNLVQVAAPAFAGLVSAIASPTVVLWLAAIVAALGTLAARALPDTGAGAHHDAGLLAELRSGWRAYWAYGWLVAVDGAFALWHLVVYGPLFVLGPVVARAHDRGALGWGLMLAGVSVGGVLGGALVVRLRPRRPLSFALIAFSVTSVWLGALWFEAPLPVLVVAAAIAGVGFELLMGLWDTVFQGTIPRSVLGKLAAYDYLASVGTLPLGYALAAPLAAIVGARGVFGLGVVITVAITLGTLAVPSVRHLPSPALPIDE